MRSLLSAGFEDRLGFPFDVFGHEVVGDVFMTDRHDSRDFFHKDDFHSGRNVFPGHDAALAGPDHRDIDDSIAESDEFDVAPIALQEGTNLVDGRLD